MAERTLTLTVPGVPVGQPRARATAAGKHARIYSPTRVKQADGTTKPHPATQFKSLLRMIATQEYQGEPLEGPLKVDVEAIFPRPRNKRWKTKPMPRYWHTGKPDRDNLDKCILDALTGIVWLDDKQVCDGRIEKWVAAGGEGPYVAITINELGESDG